MNISNIRNTISNQHDQFKTELINWIVGQGFTHGVSLSHHRGISLDRATHDLKRLHRDIDRKLLGSMRLARHSSLAMTQRYVGANSDAAKNVVEML